MRTRAAPAIDACHVRGGQTRDLNSLGILMFVNAPDALSGERASLSRATRSAP
jgi:hypothetical protein